MTQIYTHQALARLRFIEGFSGKLEPWQRRVLASAFSHDGPIVLDRRPGRGGGKRQIAAYVRERMRREFPRGLKPLLNFKGAPQ